MTQQHDAPVSITSARSGRSDDIKRRQSRYLVSMAVRTICFVLAIVLHGPERWVMVAAAVFLPYVAVVLANATSSRQPDGPASFASEERVQISTVRPPELPRDDSRHNGEVG